MSTSKHKLQDPDISSSKVKKQKKEKSNADPSSSGKEKKDGKGKEKEKEKERQKDSTGKKEYATPGKDQAILRCASRADQAIGPVVASFGEYEPPKVPFNLFNNPTPWSAQDPSKRAKAPNDPSVIQAHDSDRLILQGETTEMSYFSGNWSDGLENKGYPGEYLVGIHDPSTSTITLKSAPMFTMSRGVKALASEPKLRKSATGSMYEDRRTLGEAFGNKKQKQNARNQDKMKVNLSENKGQESEAIMNRVMDDIAEATKGMKDAAEVKMSSDAGRNIPQPNMSAELPSEAYPLQTLIGGPMIGSLLTKAVEPLYSPSISSFRDISPLLPVAGPGRSKYLLMRFLEASKRGRKGGAGFISSNSKSSSSSSASASTSASASASNPGEDDFGLTITSTSKSDAKARMRVLFFIALLWSFWKLNDKFKNGRTVGMNEREDFLNKLKLENVEGGEVILDDLFNRFTETQRGSDKPQFTSQKEALLLAHIFALTLHLDNYSVDFGELASEMNLDPSKAAELFKALGCKPMVSTQSSKDSKGEIISVKKRKMVLKTPIVLPVPRKIPAKR